MLQIKRNKSQHVSACSPVKEGYSDPHSTFASAGTHLLLCACAGGPTLAVSRMQRISWPLGHLCLLALAARAETG